MLGYCTNIHQGNSFQDVVANLATISSKVQNIMEQPLGIGLWFSNASTLQVDLEKLKDVLNENQLTLFTCNGFPYENFHSKVVKHNVYKPTWAQDERLDYTMRLANILSSVIETSSAGISTLPLGWNDDDFSNVDAAKLISKCINKLEELENKTGKQIHLDLEAEPGCRLQTSEDVASFVLEYFGDDETSRRYLQVCHDTCHAAVMRESAETCIENYSNAGLKIGKVQLSSAISTPLNTEHMKELRQLAEPRYLHQATVVNDGNCSFYEDLSGFQFEQLSGDLRVHFHVPIHLETMGSLQTTQIDLKTSIPILKDYGVTSWEVETYTWDVTPIAMKQDELAQSIAKELTWAANELNN